MKPNKTYWRICQVTALLLTILVFTPLVIPRESYQPELMGIPWSLWTSFLITLALVILTWIGMRVHPSKKEREDES